MLSEPIVVIVSRDLEDLLPLFMQQRKADQAAIAAAVAAADFAALRRVGHGMVGSGASYGFDALSSLGERFVSAARAGDLSAIGALQREFDDYLSRLVVKFL